MFYSQLAEFIAAQTRAATVPDLTKPKPEVRRNIVSDSDLTVIRDQAFERVLDNPKAYSDRLRAAIGGKTVSAGNFSKRSELEKFIKSKSATLFVLGVQAISPWWKSLCDDVEARLRLSTFAVGFKTLARKPGFDIHWDMGAVGATQVTGVKEWTFWPPVVGLEDVCTLRDLTPAEKRLRPKLVVTLRPGDTLFVPRGWLHRVVTKGDEPSLHVSVGIVHPDMHGLNLAALV